MNNATYTNTSHEEFCDCHSINYVNQTLFDDLHRVIGNIYIKWGGVQWTPANSSVTYSLSIEELNNLIKSYCESHGKQHSNDELFHEYIPLKPENSLNPEDLTPEQLGRLQRLNTRLAGIEQQLIQELQPDLDALQKRMDDPDDWLEDFEYEIILRFSAGKNDPDYDEENSENVILIRTHACGNGRTSVAHALRADAGINWNESSFPEGHPRREGEQCWLYHDLYDHTHIGWANMLRIDEVWIDVKFWLQHWEYKLGEV